MKEEMSGGSLKSACCKYQGGSVRKEEQKQRNKQTNRLRRRESGVTHSRNCGSVGAILLSQASLPNRAPALQSRVSSHGKDCLPQEREDLPQEEGTRFMEGVK